MTHTTEKLFKTLPLCAAIGFGAMTMGMGAAMAQGDENPANDPSTAIVTVNGVEYPLDVFRMFYNERLQGNENTPEMQERAFNDFLSLIVASQQAETDNLETNREVQAALELRRMMILSSATLQEWTAQAQPSEEDLKKAYEQFAEQAKRTEYRARHILLDDQEKAQDIIKQLKKKKGKNFEKLAEENSLGPTAEKGGDLGWFDSRQMVKPFADAVAEMEVGTFTTEPVQTQFGWHVIMLEEVRDAEPPSFEEVKPELEARLKSQIVLDKINELREKAKVELNEDVVKMKKGAEDPAEAGDGDKKAD
ncbi:peptidylprolyl isomerase [Thiorhodovibrio frisius]|uniref:peptidylprolyl isomerase n=1 Tax=Thiorhodovibrio frisius TaxID=631362 RepID=H8Z6G3_9GAMM|nr:peptidyl-prolyl cis-trans isomerase [Thiorhodovibrio frisius]EIC19661.1 parvulin-like peptidyl-prolyl isomerase [Thiorhodovibrio frisius]WPL20371.1 putative parvulin-type peptidyl-prolyl cis-trans isomerase precursor [Thiorhodovibrio frisius]